MVDQRPFLLLLDQQKPESQEKQVQLTDQFNKMKDYFKKIADLTNSHSEEARQMHQDLLTQFDFVAGLLETVLSGQRDTQQVLGRVDERISATYDKLDEMKDMMRENQSLRANIEQLKNLKCPKCEQLEEEKKQERPIEVQNVVVNQSQFNVINPEGMRVFASQIDIPPKLEFEEFTVKNYSGTIDIQEKLKKLIGKTSFSFKKHHRFQDMTYVTSTFQERLKKLTDLTSLALLIGKNESQDLVYLLLDFAQFDIGKQGSLSPSKKGRQQQKIQIPYQSIDCGAVYVISKDNGKDQHMQKKPPIEVGLFEKDIYIREQGSTNPFDHYFGIGANMNFDIYLLEKSI
ncbi:hypothetical protein FGO68_gene1465 [Halteria grandinella]|uniref:Uncharacterized protein n=1 Tax=Halteria grandinella TaxID=5974 RepID=A0A8J8NMZ9_HALGN|nr:hypothetical protein FGO68_gene1465 [Halteria grandinella]